MTRDELMRSLRAAVADERVLDAMARVPRDKFVPPDLRERAWEDVALPIGRGQTISQPRVVARMCELLELRGGERVLDVGTGSGYHAAVLARLAGWVWSVEREPELARQAASALREAGVDNVTTLVGDGSRGLSDEAPFDAVSVAAATAPGPFEALAAQLRPGGRLVAPLVEGSERLVRVRRRDGGFERGEHEHVRFVPLVEGGPEGGIGGSVPPVRREDR